MKIRFLLPLLILVTLFSTACKNNIRTNNSKLPDGLIMVSFSENRINSRAAIFLPEEMNETNISRYELSGEYDGDDASDFDDQYIFFSKEFDSYDSLCAFTKGLIPGKWNFNLYAYLAVETDPVLSSSESKEISADDSKVIFNLAPIKGSSTHGNLNIRIHYPDEVAKGCKFTVRYYDEHGISNEGLSCNAVLTGGVAVPSDNSISQLASGNYILSISFYSDEGCTDLLNTFNVLFVIQGGNTTVVETSYSTLNQKFTIEFLTNSEDATFKSSYLNSESKYLAKYTVYDKVILPGDTVFASKPEKIFAGWSEDSSSESGFTEWMPGDKTEDLILYAVWSDLPVYTVTFNSNGGTEVAAQNVTQGKFATEPVVPSKTGMSFAGWYLTAECADDDKFDFDSTPVTENIILYAKWVSVYTVNFLDSGKTIYSGESFDETYGTSTAALEGQIEIPNAVTFNTAGLTLTSEDEANIPEFVGWYYDSACEKPVSVFGANATLDLDANAGDLVVDEENRTINVYAKWNYSLVYVDSSSSNSYTDGTASGFTSDYPVKSIAEAKRLIIDESADDTTDTIFIISEPSSLSAYSNTNALFKTTANSFGSSIYDCTIENASFEMAAGGNCYFTLIGSSTVLNNVKLKGTSLKQCVIDCANNTNTNGTLTVKNCIFENFTIGSDGKSYGFFNGMMFYLGTNISGSNIVIENCTFSNNKVGSYDATNSASSGFISANNKLTIKNSTFENNEYSGTLLSAYKIIVGDSAVPDDRVIFNENKGCIFQGRRKPGSDSSESAILDCNYAEFTGNTTKIGDIKDTIINSCTFNENGKSNTYLWYSGESNVTVTNCSFNKTKGIPLYFNSGVIDRTTFTDSETDYIMFYNSIAGELELSGNCSFDKPVQVLASSSSKVQNLIKVDGSFEVPDPVKLAAYDANSLALGSRILETYSPYIVLENTDYKIDADGYIVSANQGTGGITDPLDIAKNLYFDLSDYASKTGDVYSVQLDSLLTFTAKDKTAAVVLNITDWSATAVYAGIEEIEVTLNDVSGFTSMKTFTLSSSEFYPGNYVITVSGRYNSVPFSTEFIVQVTE